MHLEIFNIAGAEEYLNATPLSTVWDEFENLWVQTSDFPGFSEEKQFLEKKQLDEFREKRLASAYTQAEFSNILEAAGISQSRYKRLSQRLIEKTPRPIKWEGQQVYLKTDVDTFIKKYRVNKPNEDLRLFSLAAATKYIGLSQTGMHKAMDRFPGIFEKARKNRSKWEIPESALDELREQVLVPAYTKEELDNKLEEVGLSPGADGLPEPFVIWGRPMGYSCFSPHIYLRDEVEAFFEKLPPLNLQDSSINKVANRLNCNGSKSKIEVSFSHIPFYPSVRSLLEQQLPNITFLKKNGYSLREIGKIIQDTIRTRQRIKPNPQLACKHILGDVIKNWLDKRETGSGDAE